MAVFKKEVSICLFFVSSLWQVVYPHINQTPSEVRVSISKGPRNSHIVEGQFSITASSSAAWEILTDYDHLSAFVSSIKSSRRVRPENGNWIVEQVMIGRAGIFKKRIYLLPEVKESLGEKILFRDISRESFKSYSGLWELTSRDGDILVVYKLEATPAFFSPDFLTVRAFKGNVKLLLEEVRDEIVMKDRWKK